MVLVWVTQKRRNKYGVNVPVLIQARVKRSIGWAALKFGFNAKAKDAIKAHPGARWINPEKDGFDDEISLYLKRSFDDGFIGPPKAWYVPATLLELLKKDPQFKFEISYDDEQRVIEPPTELFDKLKPYQQVGVRECLQRAGFMLTYEPRVGKAQPLDAKILTPTGWCRIGDLGVDDEIVDPDGGHAKILGVFDRGTRPVYRVTTVDGASTECCDEHLWTVETPNDRNRGTVRTLTLNSIRVSGITNGSRGKNSKFFLPLTRPVRFLRAKLPVDPYVLGLLLGDGSFGRTKIDFSTADKSLARELDKRLRKYGAELSFYGRYGYGIIGRDNKLRSGIEALGLMGHGSADKFIPDEYLKSSVANRKLLLAGLLDTDGSVGECGNAYFCTTSSRLRDGITELVCSLGGYVKTYGPRQNRYTSRGEIKIGQPSWICYVRVGFNPFRLPRKVRKFVPNRLARGIAKVEYVGEKPTRCIATTAKRQLYITDGYIVTHNTPTAITSACAWLGSGQADLAVILYPNSVAEEWVRQLDQWAGIDLKKLSGFDPLLTMEVNELRSKPWLFVGCHYEILGHREKCLARIVDGRRFVLVIDEMHTAKNRKSARYRTARRLSLGEPVIAEGDVPDLDEHASATCVARIGLTGTEMRNRPRDLFGPLDLILPGQVGGYWTYARKFCDAVEHAGHWVDKELRVGTETICRGKSNEQELRQRLQLVSHKVTRAEAAPWLPRMQRITVLCNVPEEMLAKYRELERVYGARIAKALETDEPTAEDAAMIEELDKYTSAAKMDVTIQKALEHLDRGVKVRVSAHHHATIKTFVDRFESYFDGAHSLKQYPMFCAPGYDSQAERFEQMKRWKEFDGAALLVTNNLSASVGIDLADAKTSICIEPECVPADQEQWEARAMDVHLGKTVEPPLIIYPLVRGTMDEAKVKALLSKLCVIEEIVGRGTETGAMASAFRESGVVAKENLGIGSNDRSVIAAAIKSIRERYLRGSDPREASLAAEMGSWEDDGEEPMEEE